MLNPSKPRAPTPKLRRWLWSCAALWLAALGAFGAEASREHQIKAAFLYNFTKFVEWPATAFAGPETPLVLGVVGQGTLAGELEKVVKDRKFNGRDLIVKTILSPAAAKDVHLLYVASGEDAQIDAIMAGLKGASTLTVGESEAFVRKGGIINFVPEADKVRFELNSAAADRAGLKVSAQLQKLAKTVRKQP